MDHKTWNSFKGGLYNEDGEWKCKHEFVNVWNPKNFSSYAFLDPDAEFQQVKFGQEVSVLEPYQMCRHCHKRSNSDLKD